MSSRISINFGPKHINPIPNASRIGNLVMSSVILGKDPLSGELLPNLSSQCIAMFNNVRLIAEASGGTINDIIKMTVWLRDYNDRDDLNKEWLKMFPDPNSRPARHVLQYFGDENIFIQCDITMFIC